MPHVLMVAYHFPPLAGSSGIQRTLRFVQQLPHFGWSPIVLTVCPAAYERTSDDLLPEVPREVPVTRAFALDTARQLTLGGKYLAWMARPDRWVSWRIDGVRQGMAMIRKWRPRAIWSTYPIATAHTLGHALHQRTGLPWVADFRDPMAQPGYPADPKTWRAYEGIERQAMQCAAQCVFTTPGAARAYAGKYPSAAQRIQVIENGYDEESFAGAEPRAPAPDAPLLLLHSGIVYPSERDPSQLFKALALLRDERGLSPQDLRLRFRAAVHDDLLAGLAATQGVEAYLELAPAIGYREALAEMSGAGALLVLQASNCNAQIPAKLYEYLRAGRPVAALTDEAGDTAAVLRDAGVSYRAPLDNARSIADLLWRMVKAHRAGVSELPRAQAVQAASRRARAQSLAHLLDRVAGVPAAP